MANVSYVNKLEAVYTKSYYKIMSCYQFGQRSNLVKYYSEVNRKRACLILSGIILKKKKVSKNEYLSAPLFCLRGNEKWKNTFHLCVT